MLTKVLGIFIIGCCGALKMPLKEISKAEMQTKTNFVQRPQSSKPMLNDTTNRRNTVYVKDIKYTRDGDLGTFAKITFKNTTKRTITDISFLLDGNVPKGCNKSYEIKQKINLKPNQSLTMSQRLATDDCEAHVIKNIRIRYTINVNFTLD
ncbi:hypothetical protein SAMN05421827_116101 [Pedobacter terrae]|uniref:Uncharacterized protein n=1 Tax=Pedobacter terrae TaxID=405671 RepID=A0A1G7ZLL7_9SPHI|nr:hypothetical protein [Pedobacter terrae]SDH09632.1 hypothetical protein SAMN05421827_116101 [Pedobacter terrae]